MGVGGSFTAVQGGGGSYSRIGRASSLTVTKFRKVKLNQSLTENLIVLYNNLCCLVYYFCNHISRLVYKSLDMKYLTSLRLKTLGGQDVTIF